MNVHVGPPQMTYWSPQLISLTVTVQLAVGVEPPLGYVNGQDNTVIVE